MLSNVRSFCVLQIKNQNKKHWFVHRECALLLLSPLVICLKHYFKYFLGILAHFPHLLYLTIHSMFILMCRINVAL